MGEKIASFLFTLALMGWDIYNIASGRATAFTWIMLGVLALGGLFEFGAICEAAAKKGKEDKPANVQPEGNHTAA